MSINFLRLLIPLLTMVSSASAYSIGTPGIPWTTVEKSQWRSSHTIQRSYESEVVAKIQSLSSRFEVSTYGALSMDPERYPMYYAKTKNWDSKENSEKPCVLITGGVHGYEKSGVQGAIRFLETKAEAFSDSFRILVAPCVSPWGYETIQRWNCRAVDPNRSFNPEGEIVPGRSFNPEPATEESTALIGLLETMNVPQWMCHVDLHETTDTDDTEFRPAKASRDGVVELPDDEIPDGFYLVSDSTKSQSDWYTAMIESVRKVTHIAEADEHGKMIGEDVIQDGVIAIPSPKSLGLCAGVTNAEFATTTEVYPDSPRATEDICNDAQIACIEGALRFIQENHLK